MAMLSKDPERRPGGAQELADRAGMLRDTLAAGGAADLSMVTDPSGWSVRRPVGPPSGPTSGPMSGYPSSGPISGPVGYGSGPMAGVGPGSGPMAASGRGFGGGRDTLAGPYGRVPTPGEPGVYASGAIPGVPPGVSADLGQAAPVRRRRTANVLLVVAGFAIAVGIGALAMAELTRDDTAGVSGGPTAPVTDTATVPSVRPISPPPRRQDTLPIAPGKSAQPIARPSVTVSGSASETPRPSPTPSTTTPTPSPPTPEPDPTTPTPTPDETSDPPETDPPDDSEPPDGET